MSGKVDAKSPTCTRAGCENKATHHLEMKAWAIGQPKSSSALKITLGLALCHGCAMATELDDVLTDKGWDDVRRAVMSRGLAEPDRASVELMVCAGLPNMEVPKS